jgi:hypothetical protein
LFRQIKSNGSGQFLAPVLPAGVYRVRVSKAGFATLQEDSIVVNVGATASVAAVLRVGDIAETVSVDGGSATIDPSNTRSWRTNFWCWNSPLPLLDSRGSELVAEPCALEANLRQIELIEFGLGIAEGLALDVHARIRWNPRSGHRRRSQPDAVNSSQQHQRTRQLQTGPEGVEGFASYRATA